ncbi:RluA family pseudouridine synthase [Campylobacter ureolyticus ACS-301-V-Sch3b]|uniref:RNA pseudouridylate synthase n=1 Tax=Campylobacter ureolyticus ACS-301-V-Sch3b TaxID=883165 RepID=S3XXM1_9BACT|nr:RluA family pseudouridine synthase [Campylobacter ureolyticus]EPH10103.1 RluA family pseudouridine synthase [Campylobacter ureolyticus ACS-301-V-Sch3b]
MPYIMKKIAFVNGEKAYQILLNLGYKMSQAQKLIDKKRLFNLDEIVISKNQILNGDVFLIDYECEPKGLEPIFEDEILVAFDKPSGVLTHPNGRNSNYSMNDEIWSKFGRDASVAHRLDKETSGVLLVAKNKTIEKELKLKFQNLEIKKTYFAIVKGIVEKNFTVENFLNTDKTATSLKNKMYVQTSGKFAKTEFEIVQIYEKIGFTLLKCIPKTGRQHQIRVQLFHVKHPIVGDALYGVSDEFASDFLDEKISVESRVKITGAKRLLLHSESLEFEFNGKTYNIKSNFDAKNEFEKLIGFY